MIFFRIWIPMVWMGALFAGPKLGWMSRPGVSPRAQYWGQDPLFGPGLLIIFIKEIFIKGSRAAKVTSWMTQSWLGVLIFWKVGELYRGIWTGWSDGSRSVV